SSTNKSSASKENEKHRRTAIMQRPPRALRQKKEHNGALTSRTLSPHGALRAFSAGQLGLEHLLGLAQEAWGQWIRGQSWHDLPQPGERRLGLLLQAELVLRHGPERQICCDRLLPELVGPLELGEGLPVLSHPVVRYPERVDIVGIIRGLAAG